MPLTPATLHLVTQQHYTQPHCTNSCSNIIPRCAVVLNFLRSSVALIYTAEFLHSNITPKYTAASHLLCYAAASHLFVQQHYTYIRSRATDICIAVLFMQQHITLMYTTALLAQQNYTCALLVQQHYIHQRHSVAQIYSSSITLTNATV